MRSLAFPRVLPRTEDYPVDADHLVPEEAEDAVLLCVANPLLPTDSKTWPAPYD